MQHHDAKESLYIWSYREGGYWKYLFNMARGDVGFGGQTGGGL